MNYTKPFQELTKADTAIAGGKGASLGEMTQAGIPVPPGFVVLSQSFETFIDQTNLRSLIKEALEAINPHDVSTVELASNTIQSLIIAQEMPEDMKTDILKGFESLDAEYVAVRSSATAEDSRTAAWAGQLESYLNTTKGTIIYNIQQCWASLFASRAIFYRFEKHSHADHISIAVVVQKMIESEVAGIAFTVHPVTEDQNQMIIEAGYGLGEAVVSGQITPDSYIVTKDSLHVEDAYTYKQERKIVRMNGGGSEWVNVEFSQRHLPKQNHEQVKELASIIKGIERHYGFPCDIEWAYEAGSFYIVQSRPITTLQK